MGCMGLRGSEITLYGESPTQQEKNERINPNRNKVKTNGHFTTFMQVLNLFKINEYSVIGFVLFSLAKISPLRKLVILRNYQKLGRLIREVGLTKEL